MANYTLSHLSVQKQPPQYQSFWSTHFPLMCSNEIFLRTGETITFEGPSVTLQPSQTQGMDIEMGGVEVHEALQIHLFPRALLQEHNVFMNSMYTTTGSLRVTLTNFGIKPFIHDQNSPIAHAAWVRSLWFDPVPSFVFTHAMGGLIGGARRTEEETFLPALQIEKIEDTVPDRSSVYFINADKPIDLEPRAINAVLYRTPYKQVLQPRKVSFFLYLPQSMIDICDVGNTGRASGRPLAFCNEGIIDPGFVGNILLSLRAWRLGCPVRIPARAQLAKAYYLRFNEEIHTLRGNVLRGNGLRGEGGFGSTDSGYGADELSRDEEKSHDMHKFMEEKDEIITV